ncbi:PREDICTED: uncharacterized protein LOC104759996 [Camelina sativa]|uniref:Uncharacterized protein LOC104759996 n=1 Tax=Camelina sativa TaxID=90675 RepID=A0ABM1R723_CAMSA|nr:PREDICTED: uncharacterized protein LOC104759996 [Camelina sativa]
MGNKLLYYVIFSMFLLFTMLRVWRETTDAHVYRRKEWIETLFESGFASLRVGFHEDQKYFRLYFIQ